VSGVWSYHDYTYTEAGPIAPSVTSPSPGFALTASGATFTWNAGTEIVQRYQFRVWVTGAGHGDLYDSGTTLATQATVNSIPTQGGKVYVRLYYLVSGVWSYTDYVYTEKSLPAAHPQGLSE